MEITDHLTPYKLAELIAIANEPDDENIMSLDEYKAATEYWRTKS